LIAIGEIPQEARKSCGDSTFVVAGDKPRVSRLGGFCEAAGVANVANVMDVDGGQLVALKLRSVLSCWHPVTTNKESKGVF